MQLIDGVCQKHRPLVFLAGLLLVKEYATYVKFHTGVRYSVNPGNFGHFAGSA
jgi:hypothetical protein